MPEIRCVKLSTLSRTACHTSSYRWREMSLKCELSMSLELPPPSSTKLLSTLTLNGRRLTRLSSSPASLGHWSLHRTAAGQDHDHNFRTLSLWFVCPVPRCQLPARGHGDHPQYTLFNSQFCFAGLLPVFPDIRTQHHHGYGVTAVSEGGCRS